MAGNVIAINDQNFDDLVKKSTEAIVLDFWAEWCPPCRTVGPIFIDLAEEFKGKLRFGKVNVDEAGRTAEALSVQSIPTFIVFKGGAEVHRFQLQSPSDRDALRSELSRFAV